MAAITLQFSAGPEQDKIKSHPHPNPSPVKGEGLKVKGGSANGLAVPRFSHGAVWSPADDSPMMLGS